MSGSVAKAARRDLRRAVGGEALAVVDAHSSALERVVAELRFVQQGGAALERRLVSVEQRLGRVEQAINDERTDRLLLANEERTYVDRADDGLRLRWATWQLLGFWGRLRWLLTGV